MEDIEFPPWILSSPVLAVASTLGRALRDAHCNAHDYTVVFGGGAAAGSGDGAGEPQPTGTRNRFRARLLAGGRGMADGNDIGSSASSDSDDDDEGESSGLDGGGSASSSKASEIGLSADEAAQGGRSDLDDGFYTVASSSGSDVDPMEQQPYLQRQRRPFRKTLCLTSGRSMGSMPTIGAQSGVIHRGAGGGIIDLLGNNAPGGTTSPSLHALPHATPTSRGGGSSGGGRSDILHDPRVQRLLRLSCVEEFAADAARPLSTRHAAAIIALFAFAVECRSLPSAVTKGFYTECSCLYTALLGRLRDGLAFHDGVDAEGFIAALVACGLKMREAVPPAGLATSSPSTTSPACQDVSSPSWPLPQPPALSLASGGTSAARNVGLSGFDPRVVDAAIAECIPAAMDSCAASPVALGALRGLAFTYTRQPAYLSPVLVNRLHDLTDEFATSPHRRDLAYKKLLSALLEALSCSLAVDYDRINSWILAIIQEAYVVRGLFQRELLHARVVAATLTLLIRQYQEMTSEYAVNGGNVEGLPDFAEGDALIELVWRALQDTLLGWHDSTAPAKPQTLYGANLRVLAGRLLTVEVERLRCHHTITCAAAVYRKRLFDVYAGAAAGNGSAFAGATPTNSPASTGANAGAVTSAPSTPTSRVVAAAVAAAPTTASTASDPSIYFPSEVEEALRSSVVRNIVRFLLLPTSVLNVLPRGDATAALRASVIEQCSRVLTSVAATEFTPYGAVCGPGLYGSPVTPCTPSTRPLDANTDANGATPSRRQRRRRPNNNNNGSGSGAGAAAAPQRQRAQFSNGYYRCVEGVVRELIRVLVQDDSVSAAHVGVGQPVGPDVLPVTAITAVEGATAAAAACLQSLCASDDHLRSFAVSEVIDAVVAITGTGQSIDAAAEATMAANLAPCFDILADIIAPRQYTLSRPLARAELTRYAQLLCDTYTDALRRGIHRGGGGGGGAARKASGTGSRRGSTSGGGGGGVAGAAAATSASQLPTPVMEMAGAAYWRLVVRLHERLSVIAQDAVAAARAHRGSDNVSDRAARQAAAAERVAYLRMLSSENVGIRKLILLSMRCMLGIAWPGSGVLYQRLEAPIGAKWVPGLRAGPATEPGAMSGAALVSISPFLKPLSLLLALSTLFPVRSLRNKGLVAHAEHARYLTSDRYREQYLLHYYFRPTTKTDDGEAVNAHAVGDADALLDSTESHHFSSEFRSLWLLLTYYGFTSEALAVNAAKMRRGRDATVFYSGQSRLSEEQATALRHVAASAAPLMQMRSSDMHQAIADIASLGRFMGRNPPAGSGTSSGIGAGSSATSAAKSHLARALRQMCSGTKVWKKLSMEELFLLRALADLEMLRASSGSIANLTLYLHFETREFVASPSIKDALQHIVGAVSEQYLDTLKTFLPLITYQLVCKDISQLVLLTAFSLASVRGAAGRVLALITNAFPVFAAYSNGLPLLWAVINELEVGDAAQLEAFCRRLHYNAVPAIPASPHSDDRREHVRALVAVAEAWAASAQKAAPRVLFQAAARFVVGQSAAVSAGAPAGAVTAQLAGSRLAVRAAAEPTDSDEDGKKKSAAAAPAVTGVLTVADVGPPTYVQSLIRYSSAQGQVLSAMRTASLAEVERTTVAQLKGAIVEGLRASPFYPYLRGSGRGAVTATTAAEGSALNSGAVRRLQEADSLVCSAVALLATGVTTNATTVELLRYIVQGPIRLFDADNLRAATDSWSWLLANARARFMVPLLEQVVEGVQWTIAQGLGLFDGARPSQNVEVQTGNAGSDDGSGGAAAARRAQLRRCYGADYSATSPHKLLLAFLADTYVDPGSPWSLDPAVQLALYNMATSIVQYPSRLSLKDGSFAETMRLMVLVGHICRNLQVINTRRQRTEDAVIVPYTSLATLRQRWYACLLQWFRKSPPSWYFADDPALGTAEMAVLDALDRLLRDEEVLVGRASLGFIDFSVGVKRAGSRDAPVNIWGISSVVRDRVEAIRQGRAGKEKDGGGGAGGGGEEAMNRLVAQEQHRLKGLLQLLRVLVQHEQVRLRVWLTPRRSLLVPDPISKVTDSEWAAHVDAAAHHDPAVMVAMTTRFPGYPAVHKACLSHVTAAPQRFLCVPEAVDLYVTEEELAAGAPKLLLFANCTIVQALRYLDSRYAKHPAVSSYAIRSLLSQRSEYLVFYLPQLLQVLATDASGSIQKFLRSMAHKSLMFCHQLLWSLQTEGEGSNTLAQRCRTLAANIKDDFTPAQMEFYTAEFAFTQLVTSLSGELMSEAKPQRKPKLRLRLQDDEFHGPPAQQHLYLPTDPAFRIVGVIAKTAGAMQSAAKCPILVQFQCVPREAADTRTPAAIAAREGGAGGEETSSNSGHHHHRHHNSSHNQQQQKQLTERQQQQLQSMMVVKACIFKMGDDCRQDQISLQLIGLMKRILDAVGVPSYLYPYRVVTTGQDSGIIEVVPRSMSRNEIGKLVESNLAEFYVQTFGHPESVRFHRARSNFVKSVASYSVVSFILNIKDRHNGNIMIDSEGHLVHIDFGFLFDTSPGGDMNFESSPFKLTTEMIQLIGRDVGGSSKLRSRSLARALVDEESYIYFKVLVNRCYLAVRQYAREICILVELMLRSGLPCFKPRQTIANLAKRLAVGKTEVEAADFMRRRIHQARQNYRTVLYDKYQQIAEGIEM